MNESVKPTKIENDVVVIMDYSLTVDGEVVDSSEEGGPIAFLQGRGNIIPGLERELAGMVIGESKSVTVLPADGYGEFEPENLVDVPRSEFPAEIPLEIGTEIQVAMDDGSEDTAIISDIKDDSIQLDFNHPLAGKTLDFQVTITDLRAPTDEELDHGHVHDDDLDEWDDDLDDEEFDEEEDEEDELK
ncbi:FKBP-type peptidyl prolyl cis-trans isomerase/Apo-metallochaperone SlyD [Longilinea arvoryzae]|uniref:Peptidyl-prolyl cis-trans isomerase n=1 Tax=Longilinea arvoryzae TaxID=360412 RepID=A0A0S7BM33_9CHLR|nr:peptidylprolyl isomerase [Longilinea arvoryzae]GAP15051.1 FKBP-type peptidyl prolyl cis-trans isomerase/Apo-metallochaperone SlyD [Longilinea arvoryzae]